MLNLKKILKFFSQVVRSSFVVISLQIIGPAAAGSAGPVPPPLIPTATISPSQLYLVYLAIYSRICLLSLLLYGYQPLLLTYSLLATFCWSMSASVPALSCRCMHAFTYSVYLDCHIHLLSLATQFIVPTQSFVCMFSLLHLFQRTFLPSLPYMQPLCKLLELAYSMSALHTYPVCNA